MLKYVFLLLLGSAPLMAYVQVVPYPQAYNLKGQIDHIQYFSLDENWKGKGWEEQDNNIIYFHADNRPARVIYHRHRQVKEMNFEYEDGVLIRMTSKKKDGDLFSKMEYTYQEGVLKERQTTLLNKGTPQVRTKTTYQYLEGDTLIAQNRREKDVLVSGRFISSKRDGYPVEDYQLIFTYNEQGDLIKT